MKYCFALLLVFILNYYLSENAKADRSSKALADFIYNLVDYVDWKDKKSITICTYGYDSITSHLSGIDTTVNRLYNISNVSISTHVKLENITKCNLLYIAENKKKYLIRLHDIIKNHSIITVSNMPNFTKLGGILEFSLSRGKVHIKLNENKLQDVGLELSPMIWMAINPSMSKG